MERSFEPGRRFANELDFQLQLDDWFESRANPRMHKTLRCRPIDRLIEERAVMAPLPAHAPDVDRRWVLRVAPDPYLRFDTCDYSLDPAAGRPTRRGAGDRPRGPRGRAGQRRARLPPPAQSFAEHRTITALEHARALQRSARRAPRRQPAVEVRSLAVYDPLIA